MLSSERTWSVLGESKSIRETELNSILRFQRRLLHRQTSLRRRAPETTMTPTGTRPPYQTRVRLLRRGKALRTNTCEPLKSKMIPASRPTLEEFSRLRSSMIWARWPAAADPWSSAQANALQRRSSRSKPVSAGTPTNGVQKAARISTMLCRRRA